MSNWKAGPKQKSLFKAAKTGDVFVLQQLISEGTEVDFFYPPQRGYKPMTPLMIAAFEGELEAVSVLIPNVTSIDHCQEKGATALYYALKSTKSTRPAIVHLLLSKGANPNCAPENHTIGLIRMAILSAAE